jgi:hypothetical protein
MLGTLTDELEMTFLLLHCLSESNEPRTAYAVEGQLATVQNATEMNHEQ